MPYKIINRNDGFVILPNGERVERHSFAIVETINQGYEKMQKRNLISIHPYTDYDKGDPLPVPPKEGACYINGDVGYTYTKGHWEEKEIKPPLLPVKLKDGYQLHTDDKVYERQGRFWVVLGGSKTTLKYNPLEQKTMEDLAEARFTALPKKVNEPRPTARFTKSPETQEVLLMLDVTGIDLVKFAQDAFEITPLTGKASMLGIKKNGKLSQEEAYKLVEEFNENEEIALRMDRVKGKDCRLTVYRDGKYLLLDSIWTGHTTEDLKELLERHNIKL